MTWRSLFWRAWLLVGRKRRYRKCLQRIAKLERELWPVRSPKYQAAKEMFYGPGAVWEVGSVARIQLLPNITPQVATSSVGMTIVSKTEWAED